MAQAAAAQQMTTIETVRPWDRRTNETMEAYQRFLGWLDWPGKALAYASDLGARLGVGPQSIMAQFYTHDWKSRKEAWLDTRTGRQENPEEEEQQRLRKRARDRIRLHARLSEKFLVKAELLIDSYMEKELVDEEGNVIGRGLVRGVLREASEALAKGIEMERLSYGLPGAITRVEHDLRNQVEVSLNIYQEVLALVGSHICDGCRISVGEQLEAIQGRVDDAQKEILMLGAGE